jgi:hypothetical protein
VQIFNNGALFSETLNPCATLEVTDQDSNPYNITRVLSDLYILSFILSNNRTQDKVLQTEWQQVLPEFSLLLFLDECCSYLTFLVLNLMHFKQPYNKLEDVYKF